MSGNENGAVAAPAQAKGYAGRVLSVSLALCNVVGFLILAAFGWWSGRMLRALYADLDLALPPMAQFMLSPPPSFWFILVAAGTAVVAAIEFAIRRRSLASALHLAVGTAQIAALVLYAGAVFWPMLRAMLSWGASAI